MKVAFHLRRRAEAEPAAAVLLEADRVEAVLRLAARPALGPSSPIRRVAGGFLVDLDGGVDAPPGSIRLRKLAENLYLPADADLVPAPLDDEASGLTRDRGLVFLPGGRVLGFEVGRTVPLSDLVRARRAPGSPGGWRPFPGRPDRPDRLVEIALEPPEGAGGIDGEGPGEDPFDGAGEPTEIGSEGPPRPEEAGAASTLAGKAAIGAGKGLIGLGAILGLKTLADLGASWVRRAVDRAPRLTEAILGRQEGALRELLRQFREGETERALRHALPLGGQGVRGDGPSPDGKLPEVDPTYSLRSLLGSAKGPGGIWFTSLDVQAELAREYRKAAEEAERRGDYRRAAYIHGKLLDDFATAAMFLEKGGLHRDAAFIYLNRLRHIPSAARAFEAAGEVDRALGLYRQQRLHVQAGDLLRRLGEEEAAVAEYTLAAEGLAVDPRSGFLAAGDLLRDHARRPDLALDYYSKGLDDRPAPEPGRAPRPSTEAVPCSLRMAQLLADRGDPAPLLDLVGRVEGMLRAPGHDRLGVAFFNAIAELADRDGLDEARDDLRDRALMGIAAQLRREVVAPGRRPGPLVSSHLGQSRAWSPDLVGDAAHALRAAFDREAGRDGAGRPMDARLVRAEARRIEVRAGIVSAACVAGSSGEVFFATEGGLVFRFDVAGGTVRCLSESGRPVASMAVDPEGQMLILLLGEGPGPRQMVHLGKDQVGPHPTYSTRQARTIDGPGDFWLTPALGSGRLRAIGIWNGEEMILLGGAGELTLWMRLPMPFLKTDPPAALLVPPADGRSPTPRAVLVHDGPDICQVESMGRVVRRRYLGWRPTLAEANTLRSAPLAWLQVDPERFELAGLSREGAVHWSSLRINDSELVRQSNTCSTGAPAYLAAGLARSGLVAGVTRSRVDWLRCGAPAFVPTGSAELPDVSALACFASRTTNELVVVGRDGTLATVPIPR